MIQLWKNVLNVYLFRNMGLGICVEITCGIMQVEHMVTFAKIIISKSTIYTFLCLYLTAHPQVEDLLVACIVICVLTTSRLTSFQVVL